MTRSRHGFAEAEVVVLRQEGASLPVGMRFEDGSVLALGFTEIDGARARVPESAGVGLTSIPVHQLLRRLPDDWGFIVDVDRPFPQIVQASEKAAVIAASGPFPVDAEVALDEPTRRDRPFVDALIERSTGAAGISRVWTFRHRVDREPSDVLVLVDASDQAAALRYSDAVFETARALAVEGPVTTAWIDEIPVDFALWIRQQSPVIGASDGSRRD